MKRHDRGENIFRELEIAEANGTAPTTPEKQPHSSVEDQSFVPSISWDPQSASSYTSARPHVSDDEATAALALCQLLKTSATPCTDHDHNPLE
jgi:hypothetical protein